MFDREAQHFKNKENQVFCMKYEHLYHSKYIKLLVSFFQKTIYRSKSCGKFDRHPIAPNKFASPCPCGSGNSRDVSTEPGIDNLNCGRDDISCFLTYRFYRFISYQIWTRPYHIVIFWNNLSKNLLNLTYTIQKTHVHICARTKI